MSNAPLLITVGPQCAGKTSFLNSLGEEDLVDVAMDDYPASYEKVPTVTASSEILKQIVPECGDTRTSFSASSSSPRDAKSGLDRRIYSTTLRQRLHDLANTEQGLLTLIFTGTAALDDNARLRFQSIIPDGEILDLFIGVVAELYEAGCELTSETIDVFVLEARNDAIYRCSNDLRQATLKRRDHVVSWGNTNLAPHAYQTALNSAASSGRPVRFVRWGIELPRVPARDLICRNIRRFLSTGRYIPVTLQMDYLQKADALINKVNTHKELAALAGYTMDAAGFVYRSVSQQQHHTGSSGSSSGGGNVRYPAPLQSSDQHGYIHGRWAQWFSSGIVRPIAAASTAVDSVGCSGGRDRDSDRTSSYAKPSRFSSAHQSLNVHDSHTSNSSSINSSSSNSSGGSSSRTQGIHAEVDTFGRSVSQRQTAVLSSPAPPAPPRPPPRSSTAPATVSPPPLSTQPYSNLVVPPKPAAPPPRPTVSINVPTSAPIAMTPMLLPVAASLTAQSLQSLQQQQYQQQQPSQQSQSHQQQYPQPSQQQYQQIQHQQEQQYSQVACTSPPPPPPPLPPSANPVVPTQSWIQPQPQPPPPPPTPPAVASYDDYQSYQSCQAYPAYPAQAQTQIQAQLQSHTQAQAQAMVAPPPPQWPTAPTAPSIPNAVIPTTALSYAATHSPTYAPTNGYGAGYEYGYAAQSTPIPSAPISNSSMYVSTLTQSPSAQLVPEFHASYSNQAQQLPYQAPWSANPPFSQASQIPPSPSSQNQSNTQQYYYSNYPYST